jgi:uncharacterized protein YihD (DUF1040 family)
VFLGGASAEETDSGLFVYSTFPFIETRTVKSIAEKDLIEREKIVNIEAGTENQDVNEIVKIESDEEKEREKQKQTEVLRKSSESDGYEGNIAELASNNLINNSKSGESKSKIEKSNTSIQKKNWNQITKLFEWVDVDNLLSNPRIVSQARMLHIIVLTIFVSCHQ